MKGLIRAAIGQGVLINVVFVGLVICASVIALPNIPVDRFPNIQFGEVEVTTTYPGASPEEVEILVTREIEDALRDMNDIEFVRGSSRQGRSTVRVKFVDDTHYDALYDELRLRVLAIQNRLPRVNNQPLQPVFNMLEVDEWLPLVQVNLVSTSETAPLDRRALVLLGKELQNRLDAVPGVKRVQLVGERPEQFEVMLRPAALEAHGLTLAEISQALSEGGGTTPAGTIDTALGERLIRIDGRYRSQEDIMAVVIRRDGDGRSLRLGELVDIVNSGPRPIPGTIIQSISGYESVGAKVLKEAQASAPRVKDAVVAAVDEFLLAYPERRFEVIYTEDNTIEIRDGMGVLAQSLLLSVVLVMVLLFLFLANRSSAWNISLIALGLGALLVMLFSDDGWITALCIGGLGALVLFTCRAAVLAVSGVAFSFLGAILVFWLMGQSLNEITLLGFILISGIIVDDAIIVIENIQRHREAGKPLIQAAVDGTSEVFWPVLSAGLSTMAAFLPLLLMTGAVGEFFALVPIAVTTALAISLVEALIILPLHVVEAERLLGPDGSLKRHANRQDGLPQRGLLGWLARRYDRALRANLRHPYLTSAGAGFLFLLSIGILVYSAQAPRYGYRPIIRSEFFPEDLSVLMLTMRGPNGVSVDYTDAKAREISAYLRDLGEGRIWTVTTFAGMELDPTYKPSFANNLAVLMVKLPPRESRTFRDPRTWLGELRQLVNERFDGAGWSIELRPAPTGPPTGLPINVRVSGSNDAQVNRLSTDLLAWMRQQTEAPEGLLPGVINLRDDAEERSQVWSFIIDRERLSAYGLSENLVQRFLASATDGIYAGEFRRHDGDIPIRIRLPTQVAEAQAPLLDIPIVRIGDGGAIRFDDLGRLEVSEIPANLERRDFQRLVTITGSLDETSPLSAGAVVSIVRDWYRPLAGDYPGATLAFGGEAESTAKSYASLGAAFILAVVLIYGILAAQFRSYFQPFLILSNVAFSFTGVVLLMGLLGIGAHLLDGVIRTERTLFTVNSFIAIIGLSGLVVNDAIVLIHFINRHRSEGMELLEAIILGAHQRMRPIALTTLTTIAGLLPMAIGLPEFSVTWGPFATSFIAGLAVATAMTLLVVPALYLILVRWQERSQRLLIHYIPHFGKKIDE